jgi:hypothetical protein
MFAGNDDCVSKVSRLQRSGEFFGPDLGFYERVVKRQIYPVWPAVVFFFDS